MRKVPAWAELLVAAGIFIVINLLSAALQPQITVADGKGWDGVSYYAVADQLANGAAPAAEAPFVYRIGTPLLVSLVAPDNLLVGFKLVNLAANFLTTLLLVLWLRMFIMDWRIRIGMLGVFLLQWHGPVRFVHFYPVAPDPFLVTILLAGLVAIQKLRHRSPVLLIGSLTVLTVAGAIVRESALLLALGLPFARNPLHFARRFPRLSIVFFVPGALAIAALLALHELARPTNSYAYAAVNTWFVWWKPAPAYALGWWTAFGPLLVLPLVRWKRTLAFLREHQHLAVMLSAVAVFGWIGGIDTERYLFWAAPIVFVLVGRALEEVLPVIGWPVLALVVAAQAVSERVFWAVPDASTADGSHALDLAAAGAQYLVLTPLGQNAAYLSIFPAWMPQLYLRVLLGEYAILAVLLIAWLYWRMARVSRWQRDPGDRSASEPAYRQSAPAVSST